MSSESIDLYNLKIDDDYESDSQLDRYDLNDSFIDDSQCSFDVNSDNTYETEIFFIRYRKLIKSKYIIYMKYLKQIIGLLNNCCLAYTRVLKKKQKEKSLI